MAKSADVVRLHRPRGRPVSTRDFAPIRVKLPDKLVRMIRREAGENMRSTSSQILYIITQYYKKK